LRSPVCLLFTQTDNPVFRATKFMFVDNSEDVDLLSHYIQRNIPPFSEAGTMPPVSPVSLFEGRYLSSSWTFQRRTFPCLSGVGIVSPSAIIFSVSSPLEDNDPPSRIAWCFRKKMSLMDELPTPWPKCVDCFILTLCCESKEGFRCSSSPTT
jgi:hypothetical protein